MAATHQCKMILMDSSPLIYLAKANALHLLLDFANTIYISDEIYFEAVERFKAPFLYAPPPADAIAIDAFITGNPGKIEIITTQLGGMLREKRLAVGPTEMPDAGEITASSLFDRRIEIIGDRSPVLVIYEDTQVPTIFANKDVHILSTFGLLVAMEKAGHILSAQAIFNSIPVGSRPSNDPVDESLKRPTSYSQVLPNK